LEIKKWRIGKWEIRKWRIGKWEIRKMMNYEKLAEENRKF
jgi:hypothetical protein